MSLFTFLSLLGSDLSRVDDFLLMSICRKTILSRESSDKVTNASYNLFQQQFVNIWVNEGRLFVKKERLSFKIRHKNLRFLKARKDINRVSNKIVVEPELCRRRWARRTSPDRFCLWSSKSISSSRPDKSFASAFLHPSQKVLYYQILTLNMTSKSRFVCNQVN